MASREKDLRTQLEELQKKYDTLSKRIAALDIDVGRALDNLTKQVREEERVEKKTERDKVAAEMEDIERQLSGLSQIGSTSAASLQPLSSRSAKAPRVVLAIVVLAIIVVVALLPVLTGLVPNMMQSLRPTPDSNPPLPTSATAWSENPTVSREATRTPASSPTAVERIRSTQVADRPQAETSTASSTPTPFATATSTEVLQPQAVIKVNGVNLRAGPGTAYSIVSRATMRESFDIVGKNADLTTWWHVCCVNSQAVWVAAELVDTLGPVVMVSIITVPAPPSPTPTYSPTPFASPTGMVDLPPTSPPQTPEVPTPTPRPTSTPVPPEEPTPIPRPTSTPVPP